LSAHYFAAAPDAPFSGAELEKKNSKSEQSFIDAQRKRLEALRAELIAAAAGKAGEETTLGAASAAEAREYEDAAQKLTILELDSNLVAHGQQRLALVERALRKIEDGTYGQSDLSGDAIPRERLEAIPEAIYTVSEQASHER